MLSRNQIKISSEMIDFHMQSRLADKFPPDNFPPGGTCPKWNLSGGKLSGGKLSGGNLSFLDACFPGNLSGGNLSEVELVRGELVRVELVLLRCLPSGELVGGNLSDCKLSSNLSDRNFSNFFPVRSALGGLIAECIFNQLISTTRRNKSSSTSISLGMGPMFKY